MADLGALFGAGDVETFMGLRAARDARDLGGAPAVVLGLPGMSPYASVGMYAAAGPAAIRAAMAPLAANAAHHDFFTQAPLFGDDAPVDLGDLAIADDDPAARRAGTTAHLRAILEAGAVPVVLGGDNSIPTPILAAYDGGGPLTVLQIDAHLDWRDEVEGERHGLSSTMRRASEMPHVERIVQVGLRGVGSARPSDVADARAWGARLVTASQVHAAGPEVALKAIPEGARIFVCFDCDALATSEMPGVICRAPGGLSFVQVEALIAGAMRRGRVVGMTIAEYVPERDVDGIGANTAGWLAATTLSRLCRQADDVPGSRRAQG